MTTTDPAPGSSWLDAPAHRQWLQRGMADVLGFAAALDPARRRLRLARRRRTGPSRPATPPVPHRPDGVGLGRRGPARHPGLGGAARPRDGLPLGLHADAEHGGWLTEPGSVTPKSTYDHVHVGLAAATALGVGHPGAGRLLDQVVEVVDTHLWDESTRTLRESFAADWSDPEEYRGANANMHGVEAFIAMGHATGDAVWHERALDVADRLVNRAARAHGWLLPEHFSSTWDELPEYNRDDPQHPFRPFGATFGHSLEWARFLLQLEASPLVASPDWLREGAEG